MSENSAQTFNFELVSPEKKLLSEEAWQVVIPGDEGHIGVRAGHASLVATIQPGVVEVWAEANGESKKIFIAGGFADVTAGNVTVLAEQAVNVNDLDQDAVEQEVGKLSEDLDRAADEAETKRVGNKLAIAKAKLTALTGKLAV